MLENAAISTFISIVVELHQRRIKPIDGMEPLYMPLWGWWWGVAK